MVLPVAVSVATGPKQRLRGSTGQGSSMPTRPSLSRSASMNSQVPDDTLQVSPGAQVAVPWQTPPAQTSPVVQATPSLHGSVLFRCRQALAEQTSSVHGLASSQPASVVHSIAVPARALRKSQVAGNGWPDPFDVDMIP